MVLRLFLPLSLILAAPAAAQENQVKTDLSDPEVAHVAVTANTIDIEMARLVQLRLTRNDVKRFAQTMITDHTAVNEKAAALAQKLGVTPADNAVSKGLQQDAAMARKELENTEGAALDRAYIDREVAYHLAVLQAIDQVLVPTTENAELKQLLTEVRPAIAAHLDHAKKLQQTIQAMR